MMVYKCFCEGSGGISAECFGSGGEEEVFPVAGYFFGLYPLHLCVMYGPLMWPLI